MQGVHLDMVERRVDAAAPWERLPCDTEDSWPAFVAYRDALPPRKLLRPGSAGAKGITAPTSQIATWYKEHSWRERVAAYDSHLDAIRREEREGLLAVSERDSCAAHMSMLADARELVSRELSYLVESARKTDMPGLLKPGDLNKMLDSVVRLERLLRGQATDRTENGPTLDYSKLSLDELRTLEALQRKAARDA